MSDLPSVSAVLPAYNEAAVIADVVRRCGTALREAGVTDSEVLVVDDGSTDGTGEAARGSGESTVRVVRHQHNRGYGAALRTGFDEARCAAVWLLDSDGQFDPADLRLLLPHWSPRTMVAGYREHRRDNLLRRLNNLAFFTLVRILFGRPVRDVNCAFKLFPREAGVRLHSDGAMISTELVLRAQRRGYDFVNVPVPHHPRLAGTPTGANWRVVLRAFRELGWMWRHRATVLGPAARGPDDNQ